ncbi:MAG: acyl-CoA dehydrogenase [Bacteroidota bacterium]
MATFSELLTHTPSVRFFLPLIYLAWSDEVLSPSEIKLIENQINAQDWLAASDKQALAKFLDPAHPPSATQLKEWQRLMKESARNIPADRKKDLSQLSLQLANLGSEQLPGQYKSEPATKALHKIEEALGIITGEAVREMLTEARSSLEQPPYLEEAPTFDVKSLQTYLDGSQAELMDKVKLLLTDPAFQYSHIPQDKESYRELVLTWCQHLADRGYGAWSFPEFSGGKDDMAGYVAIFETLGYHDLSLLIKFGVQFGLFGGSILGLGTEKHHRAYLGKVGSLELPGCFAMTEANHGSNVRDLETTATYDPAEEVFVIHTPHYYAHKEYIGNAAAHGKMATVFAQLYTGGECYGVHAFLVPMRDDSGAAMPGVKIGDSGRKLGLNGVDNGRLWFDQVKVPRENLLDRFASVAADGTYDSPITSESRRFFTMLGTLVGGRICVPIAGLSAAKSGLSIAIKYGAKRRQFGPTDGDEVPILDYPTHQRRLMPLLAKSYALHFAHRWLADIFVQHEGEDTRELEALAAGLKALSTWHTTASLQECREACGGNGYLWVNRLADLKADTEIFTTFEGDNTVLMQLVAKGRLNEFRQEFGSMNIFGMVGFLARQASTAVVEKNPIAIRQADEAHLRDPEFHLSAFRYREENLVMSAAQRIKHRIDQGMDSYEAFLQVQTHLVTMAEAYMDRIILEQFIAAVQAAPQAETQAILREVAALYALHTMEENQGWYLRNGYLAAGKASAIRREVDKLCASLRKQALPLVDAFGIPDQLLGAPIGTNYGQ